MKKAAGNLYRKLSGKKTDRQIKDVNTELAVKQGQVGDLTVEGIVLEVTKDMDTIKKAMIAGQMPLKEMKKEVKEFRKIMGNHGQDGGEKIEFTDDEDDSKNNSGKSKSTDSKSGDKEKNYTLGGIDDGTFRLFQELHVNNRDDAMRSALRKV